MIKTFQFNKVVRLVVVGVLLSTTVCICSCQTDLYRAAARGDAAVVRRELPKATTEERNQAAEIAYKMGHAAVLDDMAKAGVAIAPRNVLNKELILEDTWSDSDCDAHADFMGENISFSQLWPSGQLKMEKVQNVCISKLIWNNENPLQYSFIERVPLFGTGLPTDCGNSLRQLYKRINCNTAEVFYSRSSSGYCTTQRIFLKFDSPTTGTYRSMSTVNPVYSVVCSMGRFQIQDSQNLRKKPRKK